MKVMSQLLEVASLADIGKCTEEILDYLKSVVSVSPIATVNLVHQVRGFSVAIVDYILA